MSSPKINEISSSREKNRNSIDPFKEHQSEGECNILHGEAQEDKRPGPTHLPDKKFNQPLAQAAYPSFLSCRSLIPIKVCKLIFITSKLVSEFVSVSDESICPSLFCNSIIHIGISVQRLLDNSHFQSHLFKRDIQ